MQVKRRISALVLTMTVLSSSLLVHTPAPAFADGVTLNKDAQIVNTGGDGIRFREGASLNYDVKGTLAESEVVFVMEGPVADGEGHQWYRVSVGSRVGWLDGRYLNSLSIGGAKADVAQAVAPSLVGGNGKITNTGGAGIRFREGASVDYAVKGMLAEGDVVSVLEGPIADGEGHQWYRVSVGSRIGWLDGRYITATSSDVKITVAVVKPSTPSLAGGYAKVANTNGDSLRVRSEANGKVIATFAPGTVITVKSGPTWDADGVGWYKVTGAGVTGVVRATFLVWSDKPVVTTAKTSTTKSSTTTTTATTSTARTGTARGTTAAPVAAPVAPPAANPSGSGVVSMAMKYVGSRYAYAGTTPAGFDCSGFVYYVLNKAGIKISRSMSAQIAAGTKISSSQLQAGDLVYFANTYKKGISHIAIYAGNGKIVHAADYGTGVTVSDLWSPYWTAHYAGAVRVRG